MKLMDTFLAHYIVFLSLHKEFSINILQQMDKNYFWDAIVTLLKFLNRMTKRKLRFFNYENHKNHIYGIKYM